MRCRCRTKADAAPDSPTRCRSRPRRRCLRPAIFAPASKEMVCCFHGTVHRPSQPRTGLRTNCASIAASKASPPMPRYSDTKISDADLADCAQAAGQSPEFLDQTFEWEKHYDYRATVVTVVSGPGKPEFEVEGDDTPAVRFSPTTFSPRPCLPDCKRFFPASVKLPSSTWCGLLTPRPTLPATTYSGTRETNPR